MSSTSPNRMIVDFNKTLTLNCSFVGFVISNIMWHLNGSDGFMNNTDVSVVNTKLSSSILSVMTWNSVSPANSQGDYACIGTSFSATARHSFQVKVACEYECRYHRAY